MANTKIWGDYEVYLDQILGQGGMGAVYRGRQISVDRPVAIKVLKKDLTGAPDFVARFIREAKLVARIVDSHVVQVFGAGESEGEHFYVMEYVEGEDLAAKLKKGQPFNTNEILEIVIGVGTALHHAWKYKIIHRDIKPSNVLITRDREIKVMDFGLAKSSDMELTQNQLIMGTAKYISPEQATGADVDIRADIYSLGCMLYELATTRAPFRAESPTSMIYQHVHKAPVPPKNINPNITDDLNGLILRCIAKRPEERYQMPDELVREAKSLMDGGALGEKTLVAVRGLVNDTERGTAIVDGSGGPGSKLALYISIAVAASILVVGGILVAGVLMKTDPNKVAVSPSKTPKPTPSPSLTPSPSPTVSRSPSPVATPSPSDSPSPSPTVSIAVSPSPTPIDPTPSPSLTPEPTSIVTPSPTPTSTPEPTIVPSPTEMPSPSVEPTPEPTPTDPPPPVIPDEELEYVRERETADGLFALNKWPQAYEAYLRAMQKLVLDDDRRKAISSLMTTCRYFEAKEKADGLANSGQLELAVNAYQEARKHLPAGDPRLTEIDRAVRSLTYQIKCQSARQMMNAHDWAGATDEWKRARESATGADADEAAEMGQFCRNFAAAEVHRTNGEHEKARKLYEELLQRPRSFGAEIEAKLKLVRDAIEVETAAAKEKERRKFDEKVRQGKIHFERAEWANARELLEAASQMGFSSADLESLLPKARAATSPPPGMVYIPGGKFTLGAGPASKSEGPEQEAALEAFYIGIREVSNGEYKTFVEANPDHSKCHEKEPVEKRQKGHIPDFWSATLDPEKPATGLDWYDAFAYAAWKGARLPGEKEWEKAAGTHPATGVRTIYPWGDSFIKRNDAAPGPNGCEGMGSGVIEWTADWYDKYPNGTAKDLQFGQKRRAARGGVFLADDAQEDMKVTRRFQYLPDRRDKKLGFRIAMSVP